MTTAATIETKYHQGSAKEYLVELLAMLPSQRIKTVKLVNEREMEDERRPSMEHRI